MVFHGFNHHRVLVLGHGYLHAASATYSRVRNVAIARYFIGRVDNNDSFVEFFRKHPRDFAEFSCLAAAGAPQKENGLPRFDHVSNDVDRAINGTAYTTRQPYNALAAITDGRDAVQGSFNARAVILAKLTDTLNDIVDIGSGDGLVWPEAHDFANGVPSFRTTSEIHNDLNQSL
jgi:hypothetical protein